MPEIKEIKFDFLETEVFEPSAELILNFRSYEMAKHFKVRKVLTDRGINPNKPYEWEMSDYDRTLTIKQ